MKPTLYLIRSTVTGMYWRKKVVRHGVVQRSSWTDSPARAWHCHEAEHVDRYFCNRYPPGEVPHYEVVVFEMVEAGTRVQGAAS